MRRRRAVGPAGGWTRASSSGLTRTMAKARTKDNLGALGRFAGGQDGRPEIVADPPLIVPIRDLVEDGTDPAELPGCSCRG